MFLTKIISKLRQHSLPRLFFTEEASLILLLVLTGLLGGASTYFWKQNAQESARLNNLIYVTEQVRSNIFRQVQTAIRARLLEEQSAVKLYGEYSSRIDANFNKLHSNTTSREEDMAVQAIHSAYRDIQKDMNSIFTDAYSIGFNRMRILDPRFADRMIGRFEGEYGNIKHMLERKYDALNHNLEVWSQYSPFVITIPLLLALCLVIYTRTIFRTEFLNPVSAIIAGAQRISAGELNFSIQEQGVEEVKNLAATVNKMANDLLASQNALIASEKQAALGLLVPVVAHNVRNPLASIRATAQVLDSIEDQQELEESKHAIITTTDRLSRWVNALVSYLHPLKPHYRRTSASKMIEATLLLLKPKITEKHITVVKVGWQNDLSLNVDPDLMEQAIYALLANAIDASPAYSLLRTGFSREGNTLLIFIHDQGGGLSFEPKYNQLVPGPSTKNFGTGLGIPIAFKICQEHGWELSFDSNGEGTRVVIVAPIPVTEN